jgi:benzoyl-CoA reductase/2-hydroxyglutaryl-CoA dehydratase subunit BcrC/BadD/HgdB
MNTVDDLSEMVKERRVELERLHKQGTKIVGYVPGGFVPEELIWASGAIPVALNRGGDPDAVLKSIEFIPRFFDTYSRSQIGYWANGEHLYRMVDMVVVPCTDKNIAAIADCWEMWTDTKLFRLGIPHNNLTSHAFDYYAAGLHLLKEELEKLTGISVTEDRLKEEIRLGNKTRTLIRMISEARKAKVIPITGSDFVKLHHASFILDRKAMVEYLESVLMKLERVEGKTGPRVFVIGSSLAEGDYKIYDLLESAGAQVVMEDFSEGMKPYWQDVRIEGEPISALAETYFRDKAPLPAFFRPARERRIPGLFNAASDFGVNGIVWYSLMYREVYEIEGIHFGRMVEQKGLPFIRLLSDYDNAEYEFFRTRIEAFVETMNHL